MEVQGKVTIYTDGACSGNPGPGGWGAIIILSDGVEKEICGGEIDTTNNKMELMAVIQALKLLNSSCNIDLYTDSLYVKNGITEWIEKWKVNGWKTSKKEPVKNLDLWLALESFAALHQINWNWVKSHSGNKYNEKADMLARNKITELS